MIVLNQSKSAKMADSGIIKYGISMDYVSSWGYKEAIREIVQNFKDYGEYDYIVNDNFIEYANSYAPSDTNFLKIGFTKKDNPDAVGKHGEGIKMAMLVLHRLNLDITIEAYVGDKSFTLQPVTYEDDMLGTCFGIEYISSELCNPDDTLFIVRVQRAPEFDEMEDYFINDDTEVIFESDCGDIVDMPAGNIYVGGIFVTNYTDVDRSYNIKGGHVDLGRDRNFPSTFDLEYHTGQIVEDYMSENVAEVESFSSREVRHLHSLPDEYVKDVEPTMLHGKMKFKTKTGLLPDRLEEAARNNREVQLKVKKLNDTLSKRKTPEQLLLSFRKQHSSQMYGSSLVDFDAIIEKSKHWS